MPFILSVQALPEGFHRKDKNFLSNKHSTHKYLHIKDMKRLTRSNEKLVAGVISGISNYINPKIDPVFLRLAFALITFFNPPLLLIYFGLVLIMPVEELYLRKDGTTS